MSFLGKVLPEPVKRIIVASNAYKLYSRRKWISAFPPGIYIELTNKCNLQCRMCPRPYILKNLDVGEMDFSLFRYIIDHIRSSGIITKETIFTLVSLGEPLMYPKLPDAIEYAKARCPQTPIFLDTNGVLLDETWSKKLCEVLGEDDKIKISLNAGSKESYKWLMGADKYDLVTGNIKQFLSIRETTAKKSNRGKPKLGIQLLVTKGTAHEAERFKTTWGALVSSNDGVGLRPFEGSSLLDNEQLRVGEVPTKRYPCLSLWTVITIDKSGNVYPCCKNFWGPNSNLCLGNIRDRSLKEIYTTSVDNLREKHLKNEYNLLPECSGCEAYTWFPNFWIWKGDRFV